MRTDDTALHLAMLERVLQRLDDEDKPKTLFAFEVVLLSLLMSLGRAVMVLLFERLDDAATGQWLSEHGGREKGRHSKRYMGRFGAFSYSRRVVQRVRNGSVCSPLDERLQLVRGHLTPAAARLVVRCCAHMTTRAASTLLVAFGDFTPSRSTIHRVVQDFGDRVEADRTEFLGILCEKAVPPPEATTVAVMLDGVMAHLVGERREHLKRRARSEGRKVGGPIGYRGCSVGALAFFDAKGNRLRTVRVARMPEADKASLKFELRRLLQHARSCNPELTVVAISDGAPNNWSFLESLEPDVQLVDCYHAMEHIQRRINRTLGVGTHATQRTSRRLRRELLKPGGHWWVFQSLERLERRHGKWKPRKKKGPWCTALGRPCE